MQTSLTELLAQLSELKSCEASASSREVLTGIELLCRHHSSTEQRVDVPQGELVVILPRTLFIDKLFRYRFFLRASSLA